jgi:hypothetical protein
LRAKYATPRDALAALGLDPDLLRREVAMDGIGIHPDKIAVLDASTRKALDAMSLGTRKAILSHLGRDFLPLLAGLAAGAGEVDKATHAVWDAESELELAEKRLGEAQGEAGSAAVEALLAGNKPDGHTLMHAARQAYAAAQDNAEWR